jgi:hypothetical protein
MRKLLLMALAGAAMLVMAPQSASAMPAGLASSIKAAADNVSSTEEVRYHRGHRHHARHLRARGCY